MKSNNTLNYIITYFMATKVQAIEVYTKALTKLGVDPINDPLLEKIVLSLGLAAYQMDSDSALVSGNDETEKMLVVDKLLIKKFGMEPDPKLLDLVDAAIETYGKSNPRKFRVVLYYLLATELKMESVYLGDK
jgi:hypothetical protein